MGKHAKNQTSSRNPLAIAVVILAICVVALFIVLLSLNRKYSALKGSLLVYENATMTAGSDTIPTENNDSDNTVTDVAIYYETDVCIPTPYLTLHLPEQWSDCLHVQQEVNESAYSYTFYGIVPGKEEVGLFIVHFNEDGEFSLGALKMDDGQNIYLNLTPMDLNFDDSWTGEEIDMICAMQESSNYLLQTLSTLSNFTPE